MSYYYPFNAGVPLASGSSFAYLSVTASLFSSLSTTVESSSYALVVKNTGPQGPSGTSYPTSSCPAGYLDCPNLVPFVAADGFARVCVATGSVCTGGTFPICPSSMPVSPCTTTTTTTIPPTTTTTSTTSTSTTSTSTSTTSTTTLPPTSTTTSTTSTSTSTTSTTTINCQYQYDVTGPEASSGAACAQPDAGDYSVYLNGTTYYTNAICTAIIPDGYYKRDVDDYWVQFGGSGQLLAGPTDCSATTTTTSTTTTGAAGSCYTVVNGGAGTTGTIYWTDPSLGPQTTTIPVGNKINICTNTTPYESPAADAIFYLCGTSCTSAGTCTDCEGAGVTTSTTTTTTSTSTTTSTTTIAPGLFLNVEEITGTTDTVCDSTTYTNGYTSGSVLVTLVNSVGTPVNNPGSTITVNVEFDTFYNNGCGTPGTNTEQATILNGTTQDTSGIYTVSNYVECGSGCNTEGQTSPCISLITSGSGDGPYNIYVSSPIVLC